METTNSIKLPYRLTYAIVDGKSVTRPGYGNAGWTVGTFDTVADARAFMTRHPEASMPCWRRPDLFGGAS